MYVQYQYLFRVQMSIRKHTGSARFQQNQTAKSSTFNQNKLLGYLKYLISYRLDIVRENDKPWLKCPCEFLNYVEHFNQLNNFNNTIGVINDCSERDIKLVSDAVNSDNKEEDRQSLHLAVQQRRDQLCLVSTKNMLKRLIKALGNSSVRGNC